MVVAILMPTFNEGPALLRVLGELRSLASSIGGIAVYLVDDGGSEPVAEESLPEPSESFEIVLARHWINVGQGAALETARQMATSRGHDVYVTMDSDGQHRVQDVPRFVEVIRGGADVAFGNRFGADSNVPLVRGLILRAARLFEFALTGIWLSDSHNGFRGLNDKAARLIRIQQNRMAHATEIRQRLAKYKHELRIVEVPVTIRYTEETLTKGQSSLGVVNILRDLAFRFLFGHE